MRLRYARLALSDLVAILDVIAAANPPAAERFERRVRQVTERLVRFPESAQSVAQRPSVRRVPLLRYPYVIYYRVVEDEVVILRVIHGARREPWQDL